MCNFLPRDLHENVISFKNSHRLQCKIKAKINQVHVQIKIPKIPTVDNFHLMNSSKRYHVYNHTTIHLLDTKYGHYGSNTLK
jgi:hypothetical protein